MIRRPKPGEEEDDLLQMQEEFLKQKSKNPNLQPAAHVTNLRFSQSTKRTVPSHSGARNPSKYAQSKNLKNHQEKRARTDDVTSSRLGDILEKNIVKPTSSQDSNAEDDKVNFPKVIPTILGNIVEKNVENFVDLPLKLMPEKGFPIATRRNSNIDNKLDSTQKQITDQSTVMDIDQPSTSDSINSEISFKQHANLLTKSYVLSSNDANEIHNQNMQILSKMSENDILQERQKLLSSLDPKLVEYLKAKSQEANLSSASERVKTDYEEKMDMLPQQNFNYDNDTLWENDILSHAGVSKWLHFDSLEKDKLEWMRGITESQRIKPDKPYEARFDFGGYLLPYTMEYTEKTKTLFHHGEEPHRPGYSLSELIELSRSTVTQQRVMALNTIAGILEYHHIGIYKDIIEIPLSKLFFVIRFAMDENKTIILEPALKAMRNLICNMVDEACLDALIGFEEGTQQPCLENDKSEIEELESKEPELKDFHLAEIDLVAALLRTNILQRLYYILETVRPSLNCVQYSMQILTRLARDSPETVNMIIESYNLMKTLIDTFLPTAGINFTFDPQIVYNGKPILSALKLFRVLTLQSHGVSNVLVLEYNILNPISAYISSGVEGTYGLKVQTEAFSILTNLLQYNVGIDVCTSLFPVIIMALYKHVRGTDIFVNSPLITTTHAAVVLQFVNVFLHFNLVNMHSYKEQIYPLLKEGVQKWIKQLAFSEKYTCGHLRLLCSILDCCKTILRNENVTMKVLSDLFKVLALSKSFKQMIRHLVPSSNLLSGIENRDLFFIKNLKSLGSSVVDRPQKVLPILNTLSPIPFLASLFKLMCFNGDKVLAQLYIDHMIEYLENVAKRLPKLCDNWFTRTESNFLLFVIKLAIESDVPESQKDLIYAVSSKLCYILRVDKQFDLQYIFGYVVFNKHWFTAERLMNLVSLSDTEGFFKVLTAIDDIKMCYIKVVNGNYRHTGPNVVLRKWQEPMLPRDWIYLPILILYTKSQEVEVIPVVVGGQTKTLRMHKVGVGVQKEQILLSSLEWILFYELCFPDLLNDIDATDRFCRIMCVFLCDNGLFLDRNVKVLLHRCTQLLFKRKSAFNFDKQLTGLNSFQDFYTQFLEHFQSLSYGDHTFASCVLVPLAQKHNVKWRKLLWSEYAGCLRALDCPENILCYEIEQYLYPEETDESLIKSYFHALSGNLLRPGTIAHKIAEHHVEMYKKRIEDI